ncbi:PhoP regulatory network YrbL family protein [Achromobacter anxifer]|uniref:PhoP regulatory network YrbL family protein n=1 Tax=Achromobacter anxifer TaxID=1287737 RepID=UPI0023F7DD0F|nr:PhoP regulatory network YrbL family protein [Achromobacter anxifer]MDF8360441.1 PhoP regulatory network YrbL family protein [Achromobacter anxifer]
MNSAEPPSCKASASVQSIFGPLDLNAETPLATGNDRQIFQHPHMPSLLVKVMDMRARAIYLEARPFKRWYKQYQRESAYRVYLTEISEYVTTTTRPSGVWQVPMARVLGVAQTTLGLGLVVEKIRDADGNIAPSVEDLARQGKLDDALCVQLDEFFDDLADAHVVLHDISPSNISCGLNADGKQGLYLIDGFGGLPLIPLYAWSKRLNSWRIRRKYARMRATLAERYGLPAR